MLHEPELPPDPFVRQYRKQFLIRINPMHEYDVRAAIRNRWKEQVNVSIQER